MQQRFCILVSQVCLCLMRNFSPPTHPSSIFLYLHPLHAHTHTSPAPPDDPGQLKIYLPKKLLECLPKCSSLPKERHRWNTNEVRLWHTREGNIYDSKDELLAGDSSLANVTLGDEEVAKKHNRRYSFYDLKTVAPRNKRFQPKPTKESYSRCTFHVGHFALYAKQLWV